MPRKPGKLSKPSYREDRVAWNLAWERENDALYGTDQRFVLKPGQPIPDIMSRNIPESVYDGMVADNPIQNTLSFHNQICVLQHDLTKKVSVRYGQYDFENRWTEKCTPKEREKWVLEGLVRTCEATHDFEGFRRYCPEITIARMNFESGKGFLDLVQMLVLEDIEKVPDEVRKVPNPIWEAMNGSITGTDKKSSPGRQMAQRINDIHRVAFLTMFVWNTLLAFYGESQEYGSMKTSKYDKPSSEVRESRIRNSDTGQSKISKDVIKEHVELDRNTHRGCITCSKTAELAGVNKLQQCKKCLNIGRDVYYCSKECQTKDWRSGRPPHKAICGKPNALVDMVTNPSPPTKSVPETDSSPVPEPSQPEAATRILDYFNVVGKEPKPGYTRSPALLHQLKQLRKEPKADYFIIAPSPYGIACRGLWTRIVFRICLSRVICEHNPHQVCIMYKLLLPIAVSIPKVGMEGLRQQLKREYRVDVELEPAVDDSEIEMMKESTRGRVKSLMGID
ncbi:hypothetical protein K435DRAFT_967210 [Dendrothele bispora CBS 962.96]|uniref:MYND-type domain-containing protein n=1 Tax=Dendrothele bispora (strain CBS 962.96) TaxID=1314807 RepID=A0A4V4HF61_DENBC|nr:hypothetical protein K435DRAFT_967210 [Dendrothele bispora CBS 962.96]